MTSYIDREPPIDPPEAEWPICPICGKETDTYYMTRDGEIVGCGECMRIRDAWETAYSY